MLRRLAILFFIVALMTPMMAAANICEDINDMANAWNDVANMVDGSDPGDYTEAEAQEIGQAVEEMYESTYDFAEILMDQGNDDEADLGEDLSIALDDLYNSEGIDEIVDSMDYVVDAIDNITDYCDSL